MKRVILGLVLVVSVICCSQLFAGESVFTNCSKSNSSITITCDGPVSGVTLAINCKGLFPPRCYNWKGNLDGGRTTIPLSRFVGDDGKRFNPNEYTVIRLDAFASGCNGGAFKWGN